MNYDIWLECDYSRNVPCDWRLPLGVLLDQLLLDVEDPASMSRTPRR